MKTADKQSRGIGSSKERYVFAEGSGDTSVGYQTLPGLILGRTLKISLSNRHSHEDEALSQAAS